MHFSRVSHDVFFTESGAKFRSELPMEAIDPQEPREGDVKSVTLQVAA